MLYIFNATLEIEAKNRDDAEIELINKMDEHNIVWELENPQDVATQQQTSPTPPLKRKAKGKRR